MFYVTRDKIKKSQQIVCSLWIRSVMNLNPQLCFYLNLIYLK